VVSRTLRGRRIFDHALVNGDDILFKGDHHLIEVFKRTSRLVGFQTSQGKNYVSPDTCLINSQVYLRRGGRMCRQGYLNLRLVKGNNVKARVAGGENPVTPEMIGKDLSKMARICPWTAAAIPAAFHRWDKDWSGSWFRPNWFIPVHLGGYGVDITHAPETLEITRSQRSMAARFVADPRLALYRKTGGQALAKVKAVQLKPVFVNVPTVLQKHEMVDEWTGRLAYYSRAKFGTEHLQYDVMSSIARRFRKHDRLAPMSALGLVRNWYVQLALPGMPTCPPIAPVRLRVPPLSG
jgi:hypothetical protein